MTPSVVARILVVDDNLAVREAVARSLSRRGCGVTTAPDAERALELIEDQAFDAVVSDFQMTGHDGLWLWKQAARTRPELRSRFVLLASEPFPEPRAKAYFLQYARFLAKPFLLDTLWHEVEAIVRRPPTSAPHSAGVTPPPSNSRSGRAPILAPR
jgi:two-component system, OmpR family, response regulator MprA